MGNVVCIFNLALDVMNNNQHGYPQRTGPRKSQREREKEKTQKKKGKNQMKQKKFGFCFEKKNVCGYINCIYYTANVIYKKILHLQLYYTTLTLLLLLLLREILTTLCGTFNRMLRPRYADARSRQHVITETIKPSEEAKSSKTFYYTTAQ